MIKTFVFEGIVANIWKCAITILFCLACYRQPDLQLKPLSKLQDAADFVNLRVPKSSLGLQVVVEKEYHIRMHGFLHGWDCADSQLGFVNDGHGDELLIPE